MGSRKKRVLVAMSGGVDSSVAAALLVEQGYDVIGATMQVWDYSSCEIEEGNGTCCSSIDVDDARAVADKLDIPFYVLNCESHFKQSVIDPFVQDYLKGKTPLPCVNCNTYLKFDHLIRKMKELDCEYLATGHYAKIMDDENGHPRIYTSTDDWKDQTYFLFTIDPGLIPKLIFPVGSMNKKEVREYASQLGLVNAKKRDSTGICFVGNLGYGHFIESQVGSQVLDKKKGMIRRYPNGEALGEHNGIHLFTVGQSRGLGISHHEKLFVIKIDSEDNSVWVGDEEYIYGDELDVINPHLLDRVDEGECLNVKIRFQHKGSIAKLFKTENGFRLKFFEPQRAITSGQAAVFYRDKQLVGGGWIQ